MCLQIQGSLVKLSKIADLLVETRNLSDLIQPSTSSFMTMASFNPDKAALLVIDMQNDFCPPVIPQLKANKFI
jgi:hypothetical protein